MLEQRVALVTGAASGIGLAIAERFAGEGARVFGFDRAGDVAFTGDVRVPDDVSRAVEAVVADAGRIDILVNSAGVREIGDVYTMPTDEWDNVIAVNLSGTFYCCQAAARHMRERGGGVIVNLSSVVGEQGNAGQVSYAAAKAGLIGITKSLARELASRNVTVNCVAPGFIETDMTAEHVKGEAREALLKQIPLGRIGSSEDVAEAVRFLVSPAASYVTGQVIRVNGGLQQRPIVAALEALRISRPLPLPRATLGAE